MPDMPAFLSSRLSGRRVGAANPRGAPFEDIVAPLNETAPDTEQTIRALAHWHHIRAAAPVAPRQALDPVDFPDLLVHSELIDVLENGRDFRYRLIGDVIDRISRDYYVGKRISEIPSQRPPSAISRLYSEAVSRSAPVCARLPYVGDDPFVDRVEALVMPLSGAGDRIVMLWGVVVPMLIDVPQG